MKQTKWKKTLALAMVLVMCLSLFPSAFATETGAPTQCEGEHSYENGVCTICGAAHTEHTYENGECTICHLAHTEHTYEGGFCTVCHLAEPVAPVVPAAPAAEQKVTLRFVRTPENASVTVYTLADGEYTVVEPEEDGSWSLLPGNYFYDASCEGCEAHEKVALTVALPEDGSLAQTESITLSAHVHVYDNGTCTVCDYEHTEHEYNEDGVCAVCGAARPVLRGAPLLGAGNTTTLTFKVRNGAWNNGSTEDIVVTCTLNEWNYAVFSDPFPEVGSRPADGYMASGWWDETPSNYVFLEPEGKTITYTYYKTTAKTVLYDMGVGTINGYIRDEWHNRYGMLLRQLGSGTASIESAVTDTPTYFPIWSDGETTVPFPTLQILGANRDYISVFSTLTGYIDGGFISPDDPQRTKINLDDFFEGYAYLHAYQLGEDVILTNMTLGDSVNDAEETHTFAVAAAPSLSTPYGPYVFKNWSDGVTSYAPGSSLTVKGNCAKLLYAVWKPTLTYDLNLPSGKSASDVTGLDAYHLGFDVELTGSTLTVEGGDYVRFPLPELSMEGYTFKGWAIKDFSTDRNGTLLEPWANYEDYYNGDGFIRQSDGSYVWNFSDSFLSQTVYAVWEGLETTTTKTVLYDMGLQLSYYGLYNKWQRRDGMVGQNYADSDENHLHYPDQVEQVLQDTPEYIPIWGDGETTYAFPNLQGLGENKDYIAVYHALNYFIYDDAQQTKNELYSFFHSHNGFVHAYQLGEDVELTNMPLGDTVSDNSDFYTFTVAAAPSLSSTYGGPYVFKNWSDGTTTYVPGSTLTVNGNVPRILYAEWNPTLTYDLNLPDGKTAADVTGLDTSALTVVSGAGTAKVVAEGGEGVSLPLPELTMTGYTFKGWAVKNPSTGVMLDPWTDYNGYYDGFEEASGSHFWYFSDSCLSQTVYAVWEADAQTVSYNAVADDHWVKGSDGNLNVTVTSDPAVADLRSRFESVDVDDSPLTADQYTIDPNTLEIHLLPAYLETLALGEHEVTVHLTDDGEASDTFNVIELTAEADDSWTRGSSDNVDVTVTASPTDPDLRSRFQSVKVDGTTLTADQYTIEPNTMEIHLLPAFLSTLALGEHDVAVSFTDGAAAEASFTVAAPVYTAAMKDNWIKKCGENLDVTVTASPDDTHTRERFQSVKVDGTALTADQYTIEPNTMRIHLLPAYLETLALGSHALTVDFTDEGAATANFNVVALTYAFTEGAGATWVKESGKKLDLSVAASPDNTHTRERFGSVKVDGVALTSDQYEIDSNTMRIHLLPAYLQTLTLGKHSIIVNFTDEGVAQTTFNVNPVAYNYTEGMGENWTRSSGVNADFIVKAFPDDSQTFDRFLDIAVDGRIVSKSDYTYERGSVRLHLSPAFMETLALGEHTLTSYFSDGGVAVTTFTVLPVGSQVSPKTGDMQDHMRVTTIAILAFLGLSASVVYVGERKKNKKAR